jgi:hypothetical protein
MFRVPFSCPVSPISKEVTAFAGGKVITENTEIKVNDNSVNVAYDFTVLLIIFTFTHHYHF